MRPVDLARAVGISTATVRKYEEWGVLPQAERSPANYRAYGPQHLRAIQAMRVLKADYGWKAAIAIMRELHRGGVQAAVAVVDNRHAELARSRREAERTVQALRSACPVEHDQPALRTGSPRRPLRIGEAARLVEMKPSAVRFWEEQGMLSPQRDEESGYRLYDADQQQRLHVIAMLRRSGYGFSDIRLVLSDRETGHTKGPLAASEQRLTELADASLRCARATATFWEYLEYLNPNALDPVTYQRYYGARRVISKATNGSPEPECK